MFFCCFSLSFCLYFSRGGEKFNFHWVIFMFYCCCSSLNILIDFSRSSIVLILFRFLGFVSFLICIIFFRLFFLLFDLGWKSFENVPFSFLCLVCRELFVTCVVPRNFLSSSDFEVFVFCSFLLFFRKTNILSFKFYWMSYCFYYYGPWSIIAFDVFSSNYFAGGIWGLVICVYIFLFHILVLW